MLLGMRMFPFFYTRKKATLGVYFALVSFLLVCFFGYLLIPELALTMLGAYMILIILASLFIGPVKGRIFSIIVIACTVIDAFMVHFVTPTWTWLPPLDPQAGFFLSLIFTVGVLIAAILIVQQVVGGQEVFFPGFAPGQL